MPARPRHAPPARVALPARRARARTAALALGASALGASCYRYVPAVADAPGAGASIRAHLTPEGAARLEPTLGARARLVDGRVFAVEPGALVMDVTAVRRADDARATNWAGERVQLPRDAVARVESRRLDRARTLRLVAASVAGAVLAGWVFGQIDGSAESRGNPRPPDPRP